MNKGRLHLVYSAIFVIITLFGSKLLGFVRQAVIAGIFGASDATDAFFIANEFIINITGAVMAALITALVTIYVEKKEKLGKEAAESVISRSLCYSFGCAAVFGVILFVCSPLLSKLLAPGLLDEQQAVICRYLRVLSAVPILTVGQANLIAVLNAEKRFAPSKLYGIIYNPIAIIIVLLVGTKLGIQVMLLVCYFAQLIFLLVLYLCSRRVFRFRFERISDFQTGKALIKLLLPVLISNLVLQLNIIGAKAICSLLGESYTSFFSYGYTLEQLVTGTFTAALSLILLPSLAEFAARADYDGLGNLCKRFATCIFEVLAFVAMFAFIYAKDIVSIVYLRGAFTAENAKLTAAALRGFAVGFPIIAIRDTLRQVHFTTKHLKMTILTDAVTAFICVLFGFILYRFIGVFGVSLSVSLAALCSSIFLFLSARNKEIIHTLVSLRELARFCVPFIISTLICYAVQHFLGCAVLIRLMIGIITGGIAYLASLFLMHCELTENLKKMSIGFFKRNRA